MVNYFLVENYMTSTLENVKIAYHCENSFKYLSYNLIVHTNSFNCLNYFILSIKFEKKIETALYLINYL